MLHVLIIAACVGLHLGADPRWRPIMTLEPISGFRLLGPAAGPLVWLAPLLVGWFIVHLACVRAVREMDRSGRTRAAARAERRASGYRSAACLWVGLGWLALTPLAGVARALEAGGLASGLAWATAELLGFAALTASLAGSWWSFAPVESRYRQALLLRDLDAGRPVWPIPSRGEYTLTQLRNHALWILLPVVVLLMASRALGGLAAHAVAAAESGALWASWMPAWARRADASGLGLVLDLAGLLAALALMPLLQARVWDTVRLGAGEILDSVRGLCDRAGVRVRRVLVWRTRGLAVNAVVLGAFPRLRYLIFTDAMLEAMPLDQVRAVAAHEIGHLRRHHVPWLIAGLGAVVTFAGEAVLRAGDAAGLASAGSEGLSIAAGLALALPVMGWVSRRFEWQADADAARLLSPEGEATATSAATVSDALAAVASLNHADPERFSWRHGSIAHRRRRLRALGEDARVGRLNDAVVRRIKAASVAAWALIVGLSMV
jgi:Zn-dependent protease with chaperone function